MSLDRKIKMPQVLSNAKFTVGLNNTASQSVPGTEENMDGSTFFLPIPKDPEPAECAIDKIVGYRGTEKQTKYKVLWYGYGAGGDILELDRELPIYFVHRCWAAKR